MNILKEIIKNQLIKLPIVRRKAQQSHITGLNKNLDAVEEVIQFYKQYIDPTGKAILELGPGQTHQVAKRFQEEGATLSIADIDQYLDLQLTHDLGLNYRIYDGKTLPFESASFDIIISYTVYEHIRYPKITVEETYRLLKTGGEVVHLIDLGDHFSYGINEDLLFNCLRYSKRVWNAMTWNRSSFVNRLRQSEWVKLHQNAGFTIIQKVVTESEHIKNVYESGKLEYLNSYSREDRFTSKIALYCKK